MIGPRLFMRSGLVISVIGHIMALLLGLLFAGANPFDSMPAEAIQVDIVTPDQVPQFAGEPGPSNSSSMPSGSSSANPAPASQVPPPPAATSSPQSQQKPQPQQRPPRSTQQAAVQPQSQPQVQQPVPPPAQPPHPDETEQPGAGESFALPLALPDGRLGGGFDAPAIDTAKIGGDDTTAFRDHLKSCSTLPVGIDPSDKVRIVLRVALKPNGTLAAQPQLIEGSPSEKGPALLQSAVTALRQCQPYTMLPADKYKEWKVLDLSFTPQNFVGG
jgi:hypothetical protein